MKNIETGKEASTVVVTEVTLRDLTTAEINKYLNQDPNFNTYAIGFDPVGNYSCTFVKELKGSYNNFLRGMPLEAVAELLPKVGYEIKI